MWRHALICRSLIGCPDFNQLSLIRRQLNARSSWRLALILMCVTSCSYNGSFPENLLSVPPSYCQSFPTYHPAVCSSIIHNISIWKLNIERNLVTPSTFSIDRSEPAACLVSKSCSCNCRYYSEFYIIFSELHLCSRWLVDDVSWIVDHGHVQRAIVIRGI